MMKLLFKRTQKILSNFLLILQDCARAASYARQR